MADSPEAFTNGLVEDPIVRHGRREAALVLAVFVVALVYTVGYCARFGFGRTADDLTFVLGFPSWVFWGVVAPWLACTAFSFWFSLFYMREEPLEEAAAPADAPEDGPHRPAHDDTELRDD